MQHLRAHQRNASAKTVHVRKNKQKKNKNKEPVRTTCHNCSAAILRGRFWRQSWRLDENSKWQIFETSEDKNHSSSSKRQTILFKTKTTNVTQDLHVFITTSYLSTN